jgi:hypothetical protein
MGFRSELHVVLSRYNKGALSETPDGILAGFLDACVKAWDTTNEKRAELASPEKFKREAKVFSYNRLA